MPTYKNEFSRPKYYDHEIVDENWKKIGTVRVKPSSICWKPANAREFRSVSLDKFSEWINSSDSGSRKTKS